MLMKALHLFPGDIFPYKTAPVIHHLQQWIHPHQLIIGTPRVGSGTAIRKGTNARLGCCSAQVSESSPLSSGRSAVYLFQELLPEFLYFRDLAFRKLTGGLLLKPIFIIGIPCSEIYRAQLRQKYLLFC